MLTGRKRYVSEVILQDRSILTMLLFKPVLKVMKTMPVYSTSLGCLAESDAPFTQIEKKRIPIGTERSDLQFDVRGGESSPTHCAREQGILENMVDQAQWAPLR